MYSLFYYTILIGLKNGKNNKKIGNSNTLCDSYAFYSCPVNSIPVSYYSRPDLAKALWQLAGVRIVTLPAAIVN